MSGLLKNPQGAVAVGRLPKPGQPIVAEPIPDPRIAALEQEITRLERLVDTVRQDARTAIADARKAGRAEVVADDEERLKLVGQGLAAAVAEWRGGLAQVEQLAASLATTVLEKIFGDDRERAAMVRATLQHHVERLDAEAIVHVRVSTLDFVDPAAVEGLAQSCGLSRTRLTADRDLPPGACRVALRLGEVDLAPQRQWAILADLLRGTQVTS
jgi:flagellar biosynthesis/type III secretory pathway protein FliH